MDLLGAQVHWVDFGGPGHAEAVLVCVHGLGGSTVNWSAWAPLLTDRWRVIGLDLAGFGYTEPGQRSGSVDANTELLDAFMTAVRADIGQPDAPLVLVGNSMGGLLSARVAGRRTDVVGVALFNPALPHAGRVPGPTELVGLALYAHPAMGRAVAWGRRRLRSPEQLVDEAFRLCLDNPGSVSSDVIEAHTALARHRLDRSDLDPLFEQAAHGTVLAMTDADLHGVYAALQGPVLLVHGTHDRLVPYSAAVAMWRACPTWDFVTATRSGHIPMLEKPAWLAQITHQWLVTKVVPSVAER